ncbi:MAG: hypothetical protein R3Y64_02135 [Peptostreptococcaceae bacterium]
MNKKKFFFYIFLVLFILGGIILVFISPGNDVEEFKTTEEIVKEQVVSDENEYIIEFLNQIAGLKASNIEIKNSPVSITGEFLAPRETILNGFDYLLKSNQNDNIENIQIDIGDNFINLSCDYKINNTIKTPISLKLNPSLDSNKNLVLKVDEVKFLDLKLASWIVDFGVNNILKDIFEKGNNLKVEFKDSEVILAKENFDGINLEKLSVKEESLEITMNIDLEKILLRGK